MPDSHGRTAQPLQGHEACNNIIPFCAHSRDSREGPWLQGPGERRDRAVVRLRAALLGMRGHAWEKRERKEGGTIGGIDSIGYEGESYSLSSSLENLVY